MNMYYICYKTTYYVFFMMGMPSVMLLELILLYDKKWILLDLKRFLGDCDPANNGALDDLAPGRLGALPTMAANPSKQSPTLSHDHHLISPHSCRARVAVGHG